MFTPKNGQLISNPASNGFVPQNGKLISQDQTQQPQSTGNPVLDFLGGLAKPFVQTGKNIGAGAFEGGRALDQAVGSPVAKTMGNQNDYFSGQGQEIKDPFLSDQEMGAISNDPTKALMKQAGNSAAIASWAVPGGKSLATAIGLGGLSGGLQGLGEDNVTPMSELSSIVTGAGTGGLLKGAGGLINKGGQMVQDAGNDLALKGLKPSPSQMTNFKKATGIDLGDFLATHNIAGDFKQAAEQHINDLQDQFDKIALDSGTSVPSATLDNSFGSRISDLKNSTVPMLKAKAEELGTLLQNLKSQYGENPTVADMTKERRAYDDLLNDRQYTLPAEQASYLKPARDALQEAIQKATAGVKGANGMSLDQLGTELHNFHAFNDIAQKQSNLGKGSNVLGLINSVLAGAGGTIGGLPGAITGFALGKASQNPKVIGAGVKMLKGAGQGIQKLSSAPINSGAMEILKRAARAGVVSGANNLVNQ